MNQRLKVATGLAMAALALILVDIFGEGIIPSDETRGVFFATIGIILSIAAFAVSRQKSVPVSALLVVNGIILTMDGLVGTRNRAVVYFPGPVMGFIFGLIVLALGIAKSAMTARASINLK